MLLLSRLLALAAVSSTALAQGPTRTSEGRLATIVRRETPTLSPRGLPQATFWKPAGTAKTSKSLDPLSYFKVTCEESAVYTSCKAGSDDTRACCNGGTTCDAEAAAAADNCLTVARMSIPCVSKSLFDVEQCCSTWFSAYFGNGDSGCSGATTTTTTATTTTTVAPVEPEPLNCLAVYGFGAATCDDNGILSCSSGFLFDATARTCTSMQLSADYYATGSCPAGMKRYQNLCITCPGLFPNNAQTCSPTTALKCTSGNFNSNGNCIPSCDYGLHPEDGVCYSGENSCPSPLHLFAGSCFQICPTGTMTDPSDSTRCIACKSAINKNVATCANNLVTSCESGYNVIPASSGYPQGRCVARV
ncbi:hypothetical protein JCM10207_006853 [Rhodosporidiobolus poonsookiae]